MDKRKIFSILSVLGVLFAIALGISYVRMIDQRGEVIQNRVAVPDAIRREFFKVTSRVRAKSLPEANFQAPDGSVVSWDDFDGDYLLVNFWATWCAPCVVELPSLEKLKDKFEGKGMDVIAISLDFDRNQEQISRFLSNRSIGQFAAYWDHNKDFERAFKMIGLPTTYLLDPAGNLLYIFEGEANWNSHYFEDFFNDIISQ